jgi:hypothetical protein
MASRRISGIEDNGVKSNEWRQRHLAAWHGQRKGVIEKRRRKIGVSSAAGEENTISINQ